MRTKPLLLGTLALGLVTLLVLNLKREAPVAGPAKSPLVPAAVLDGAQSITVKSGPKSVTVEKDAAGIWGVKDRFGLPADLENRLTPLLRSLQKAESFGLLTSNPKRLEKLELDNATVTVTAAGGQVFAAGFGKTTDDGLGAAVRLRGEAGALRTNFTGYLEGDPIAWIDQVLFSAKIDEVREVEFAFPDGKTSFKRPEKDKPFEAKDPIAVQEIVNSLATLRISDAVAKGDADVAAAFAKSWSAKLTLFDGATVTATFAKGADKSPNEPGKLYVRAVHSDPKHRMNQLAGKAEFVAPPWLAEQIKPTLAEFNKALNPPPEAPAAPAPTLIPAPPAAK